MKKVILKRPFESNKNMFNSTYFCLLFALLFISEVKAEIKSKYNIPTLSPRLHISEIMASNVTSYGNPSESFDWIEIFNNTNSPIDLANYYLSDTKLNYLKFRFTSTPELNIVPAGGYLIIWASDMITNGPNHTNFALSQNGEFLALSEPNGTSIIDSLTFPKQRTDVSYGLNYTADRSYNYFNPSSPNTVNNISNAYLGILPPVQFSQTGGFFSQNFNLTLNNPTLGSDITYTTDGSDPHPSNVNSSETFQYKNSFREFPSNPPGPFISGYLNSHLYNLPIFIQDRTNIDSNFISKKASSFHNVPPYIPDYNLKKATIIRAIASKPGYLDSDISSNSYFFNSTGQNPYLFPIVSIISSEKNLFEYSTGIYTAGNQNDGWRTTDPTGYGGNCAPGNYQLSGDLWERSGNMEYINQSNAIINENIKLRIHGGCSTTYPLKSLRLESGTKFNNHSFFNNFPSVKHDRIILRNSGNDFYGLMFRDVFIQNLVKNQNFETQKSKPSVFYLNGEYYGLLNIRERYDKYYFKNLYNTPLDSIDIVEVLDPYSTPDYGDNATYEAFKSWVLNNDVSANNNFQYAASFFDPKSLLDYQVTETYIGNGDWPQNNVKAWRKKVPYNPNLPPSNNDGRFRWMLYDTDFGLGTYHPVDIILFSYLIDRPGNELFKKLLDNQNFKNDFINRYADNLNSIFRPTYAISTFNTFKNQYKPLIGDHIRRWKTLTDSLAWEQKCSETVAYLNDRPEIIKTDLISYFGKTGFYNLTLNNSDLSKGHIKINELAIKNNTDGIDMNPNSWTGNYFNNTPIKIVGIPNAGYKFKHWIHNGQQIMDTTVIINGDINETYEIIFESNILSNNPIPIPYNLDSCTYVFKNWPNNSTSGTYPKNMRFCFYNTLEPTSTSSVIEGFTNGLYNYTTRTRINGLGQKGFSFINTTSTNPLNVNPGYPIGKLGGAILALNTLACDSVLISFKARTIIANPKKYALSLQIREGDQMPFEDFNPVVNYNGAAISNDSATFQNITLPNQFLHKPYIQILWKYTNLEIGTGARDQLGIDDIIIQNIKKTNITRNNVVQTVSNPLKLISLDKITGGSRVQYVFQNAVLLLPNFEVTNGSFFVTKIETCEN